MYSQDASINFQATDKVTSVVNGINKALSDLQSKVQLAQFGFGGLNKATEAASKSVASGSKAVVQAANSFDVLSKAATKAGAVLEKAVNATVFLQVGNTLREGVQGAIDSVTRLDKAFTLMNASGVNTGVIDEFNQLGSAIAGNQQAVEGFVTSAVTRYNEFQSKLVQVNTIAKGFAKEVEINGKTVKQEQDPGLKKFGADIQNIVDNDLKNSVTSVQALEGAYEALSSGFTKAADSQAVMSAGLKLTVAGGAEAGSVLRLLGKTLNAYGMSASEAGDVAATLNGIVDQGITTIPELATGFGQTAVTAKAAGISLKDLSAATALLTTKGYTTPAALTGIESLSSIIIDKTPEAAKALAELRDQAGRPVKFDIAELKSFTKESELGKKYGEGLVGMLRRLNEATGGNAKALAEIIPESMAYSATLALMANNAKDLENVQVNLGAVTAKNLEESFGIRLGDNAIKFEQIINRFGESMIKFGELLAPTFKGALDVLDNVSAAVGAIPAGVRESIASFLAAGMAFKATTGAVGSLVGALVKAFAIYQSFRIGNMLFNGELIRQLDIVKKLQAANAGLVPVALQLLGIDQTHLLVTKGANSAELAGTVIATTRIGKAQQLMAANKGLLAAGKQLLGIDQTHLLTSRAVTSEYSNQIIAVSKAVERSKAVKKAREELTAADEAFEKQTRKVAETLAARDETERKLAAARTKLPAAQTAAEVSVRTNAPDQTQKLKEYTDVQEEIKTLENERAIRLQEISRQETILGTRRDEATAKLANQGSVVTRIEAAQTELVQARIKSSELSIKAQQKEALAALANAQATEAANVATAAGGRDTALNSAATTANTRAIAANRAATIARTEATAADVALRKISKRIAIEEGLAEGTLTKTRLFGREVILKNNLLTKVATADIGKQIAIVGSSITGLITKAMAGLTTLFSGGLAGAVAGISAGFGTLAAAAGTAWAAISGPLLPIVAAVAAVGVGLAVLYDKFFGLGAAANKTSKALKEVNKDLDEQAIALSEELGVKVDLTIENNNRLESSWKTLFTAPIDGIKSLASNIGEFFGKFNPAKIFEGATKAIDEFLKNTFPLYDQIKGIASAAVDSITGVLSALDPRQLLKNYQYDQIIEPLNQIRDGSTVAVDNLLKVRAVNADLNKGLFVTDDINKKIVAGASLGADELTKQQKEFDKVIKVADAQAGANSKRLEEIYKLTAKLKPDDERRKALEAEAGQLQEQNDKLKEQIGLAKENFELVKKLQGERERFNKRIQLNTADGENGAVENALRRTYTIANDELENYARQVQGTMDGTGKYMQAVTDQFGKTTKTVTQISLADLEQAVSKLDQKIEDSLAATSDLYDQGYIDASEASKRTLEIINKTVQGVDGQQRKLSDLLDPKKRIELIQQLQEYQKKASAETIQLSTKEAERLKVLSSSRVVDSVETGKKIRDIELKNIQEQKRSLQEQIKTLVDNKLISGSALKAMEADLGNLQAQEDAKRLQNETDNRNTSIEKDKEANEAKLQLWQAYGEARLKSSVEVAQKTSELEVKQIENSRKALQNQIDVLKSNGGNAEEIKKLEQQLTVITVQEQGKRIKGELAVKEARLNVAKEATGQELQLWQTYGSSRLKSGEEVAKQIGKLELQQLQQTEQGIQQQIDALKKAGGSTEEIAKLEKQLTVVQTQQTAKRLENIRREADARLKTAQDRSDKELALLELAQLQGKKSQEDVEDAAIASRQRINVQQQAELNKQIQATKAAGGQTLELEKELAQKQLEFQKTVTEQYAKEIERRKKKIENSTNAQVLEFTKVSNAIDQQSKSLEIEGKIMESRNSLQQAITENKIAELNNQLKITSDVVQRAGIERSIAEQNFEALKQQQASELQNIELQQKQNLLQLEREKVQLRISTLQNKLSQQQLELDIQVAKKQNRSKDEVEAMELQLATLQEQGMVLSGQEQLLQRNADAQAEISENTKEQLLVKQKIALDGGALDVEIAKQNEVIATYEKQAAIAQSNLSLQEKQAEVFNIQQGLLEKALGNQVKLIEQRKAIAQQSADYQDKQYQVAINLETNESKRNKLNKEALNAKLANLLRTQELERASFELQQRQNKLALERQRIELKTTQLRQQAELALAIAEDKKIQADKTKTKEEKDVSAANVVAKQAQVQAGVMESQFLKETEALAKQSEQMERLNFERQQKIAVQDVRVEIAKTTNSTKDDKALAAEALRNARSTMPQLPGSIKIEGLEDLSKSFKIEVPKLQEQTLDALKTVAESKTITKPEEKPEQKPSSITIEAPMTFNLDKVDKNTANDLGTKINQHLYDLAKRLDNKR